MTYTTISVIASAVASVLVCSYFSLWCRQFVRFETRKRIWVVGWGRWYLIPDVACSSDVWRDSDWWMCCWLNIHVDSISKEWLRFCDEHGGGLL